MKSGLILGLGLMVLPYQSLIPSSDGNPNGLPYAGQPGSIYDAAANPPRTDSMVTYNPLAPLPQPPVATVGANGSAAPPAPAPMPAR